MDRGEHLVGRELRPSFVRLKFLFDTYGDLRRRMGFDPRDESAQLHQAFLRRCLYAYDWMAQHGTEIDLAPLAETGCRYREVAVRKFVQGDPEAVVVGLDLLAALPLEDDEKAFVLGLSPQIVVLPGIPSSKGHARSVVHDLSQGFEPGGVEDLESIYKLGKLFIGEDLQSSLGEMTRRLEAGLERVFVLRGNDGGVCAYVRLWQLRPSAVQAIRAGRIRLGADIRDSDLVDDPSLVAGIYVTMIAGVSFKTSAAATHWLRNHLITSYPGRPVFAKPTTPESFVALRRLRANVIDVPGCQIYDLGEIPN